ncbi:Uncharacterized protein APZ42_006690 [Daphnia magna]|uniref:Uncharacterized protein n=1 Tax=Daphnia magna TaxID=35525 RepID=A0A164FRD4_9CRUS|nr:Uncharacterized protein APZ42_006690 [Daphnia magna]
MQKGTVSKDCWNTVKAAGENKMNAVNGDVKKTKIMWLFEGCKWERSLKGGEKQSRELLGIHCNVGCLRETKGNGLLIWSGRSSKVLECSQGSCEQHNELVAV